MTACFSSSTRKRSITHCQREELVELFHLHTPLLSNHKPHDCKWHLRCDLLCSLDFMKCCGLKNTNPSFLQVRRRYWEVDVNNAGNFQHILCTERMTKEPQFFLDACIQACIKPNADARRGIRLHSNSLHRFIFNR